MEPQPKPDLTEPSPDREPVPRLPRGAGVHLSGQTIIRILMFAALLAGVIMLREPCANSVASFMGQFDTDAGTGDAGAPGQTPGQTPGQPGTYVRITGDMSEQEVEEALRQAGVVFDDAGTAPDSPETAPEAAGP